MPNLLNVPCVLVALLALPLALNAVDIEGAKESECFEIKKTVPVDISWITSQKIWYVPLMSRLDLYSAGVALSGKSAEELREDELYYDFCATFKMQGGNFVGEGFGGKKQTYKIKPIKGMEVFEFRTDGDDQDLGATCHVVLTDNKTFIIDACCMPGNQMVWGILSTVKKLPKKTVKEIHDHVESLGFKREYFTGLRYDHCKTGTKNVDKNEL